MRIYSLVDRATGEATDTDGCTVERVTVVEASYINWAIEHDGKFENTNWIVTKPA